VDVAPSFLVNICGTTYSIPRREAGSINQMSTKVVKDREMFVGSLPLNGSSSTRDKKDADE